MSQLNEVLRTLLKAHVKGHYRHINGKVTYVQDYDTSKPQGRPATLSERTVIGKHKSGTHYLRATDSADADKIQEAAKTLGIELTKRRSGASHHGRIGAYDHFHVQDPAHAVAIHNKLKEMDQAEVLQGSQYLKPKSGDLAAATAKNEAGWSHRNPAKEGMESAKQDDAARAAKDAADKVNPAPKQGQKDHGNASAGGNPPKKEGYLPAKAVPHDGHVAKVEFGQRGIDGSAILHPSDQEAIGKLEDGQAYAFHDETGTDYRVRRHGGDLHFNAHGSSGLKGKVKHSDLFPKTEEPNDQPGIWKAPYAENLDKTLIAGPHGKTAHDATLAAQTKGMEAVESGTPEAHTEAAKLHVVASTEHSAHAKRNTAKDITEHAQNVAHLHDKAAEWHVEQARIAQPKAATEPVTVKEPTPSKGYKIPSLDGQGPTENGKLQGQAREATRDAERLATSGSKVSKAALLASKRAQIHTFAGDHAKAAAAHRKAADAHSTATKTEPGGWNAHAKLANQHLELAAQHKALAQKK